MCPLERFMSEQKEMQWAWMLQGSQPYTAQPNRDAFALSSFGVTYHLGFESIFGEAHSTELKLLGTCC
jgi:hypothetical protein